MMNWTQNIKLAEESVGTMFVLITPTAWSTTGGQSGCKLVLRRAEKLPHQSSTANQGAVAVEWQSCLASCFRNRCLR